MRDLNGKKYLEFEKQKLLAERLFVKIDYTKNGRFRIPVFVAVANFALLSFMENATLIDNEKIFFTLSFILIGMIGEISLIALYFSFKRSVKQLEYLYNQMDIKSKRYVECEDKNISESAITIWITSLVLVLLFSTFPIFIV